MVDYNPHMYIHNWVVCHPLYTLNKQVFFIAHMGTTIKSHLWLQKERFEPNNVAGSWIKCPKISEGKKTLPKKLMVANEGLGWDSQI